MFVIDASVVSSWAFLDEDDSTSAKARRKLLAGQIAHAPSIFPFEIANVIVSGQRAGRISSEAAEQFLIGLAKLRISIEVTEAARLYHPVRALSLRLGLSIYDASYLELALREGLPLATLDERLRSAAIASGVATVG